jgi:P4 family phage/plasmid primase-like protien
MNNAINGKNVEYYEVSDFDRLAHIIKNKNKYVKEMRASCSDDKYDPFLLPERYLRKSVDGRVRVQYKQVGGVGRYFAIGGLSLQSFSREIRHTIAKDHYIDIDMVNAHPTIFSHICKKYDIDSTYLDQYIKTRDEIINDLLDINTEHDRDYIKTMILSCLNGGTTAYDDLPNKTDWLTSYKNEMMTSHNKLCKIKDDEFTEHKKITTKKHNIKASFVNKLLCNFENDILKNIVDFFNVRNGESCVLCFDGLMLPKNGVYDLAGCEVYVYQQTDIKIKLKLKEMDEGFDILDTDIEAYDPTMFKWGKTANTIFEILMKDTFDESFSDETVANAFSEMFRGDIMTVNDVGDGYYWNAKNCLWELKTSKELMRLMTMLDDYFVSLITMVKQYMDEADGNLAKFYYTIYKNAQASRKKLKSTRGMKDAYFIASTDLYDDTFEDTLNIKHHLLPIKNNKIIDLSTGIQRGRTRDDLFSFECPVEYMENANFENVDKYMATTFCENQELVDYMQERMGVFLTGETLREIDVWYGCGRNGKTTTSEILRQIMGKFFCTINKAVFIEDPKSHQAKGAAHTSHLIPMIGKRLGMSSEVKAGDEFNTTMLKGLSGGDPITYREAYSKDEKTFVSYMKGVLMTNPKPVFDFEDKALIDRLRYVHFNARFVDEPDPDKPNEYLASNDFIEMMKTTELDNFFSYLVQGAVRFYARGKKLITPSIVMAAKVAGLRESDRVGRFIEEHCVVDSAKSIKASLIQNKFEQYLQDDGETPSKRGELSKGLESLGFVKWKSHGIMKFKGLTVEGYDDSDD